MQSMMKWPLFFFALSGGMMLGTAGMTPAIAQCVQADVGVQYNISGSRVPTRRSNDVQMRGRGPCTGNTNITTGVQGNVGGTAPVTQRRRVRQNFNGDNSRGRRGRRDYGDIIRIRVNPKIDVYNPADPLR